MNEMKGVTYTYTTHTCSFAAWKRNINIASWSYFNTWEGVPLVEYHRVSRGEGMQRQIKLILLTLVINVWARTEH